MSTRLETHCCWKTFFLVRLNIYTQLQLIFADFVELVNRKYDIVSGALDISPRPPRPQSHRKTARKLQP